MEPVAAPRLRPLARFPVVFGWGLRRTIRAKKFAVAAVLAVGVTWLVAGLAPDRRDTRVADVFDFLETGVIGVMLPLLALALVGGGFGEEVQDQTLVFHLARPVSRSTLYVARYAAGLLPAALIAVVLPWTVLTAGRTGVSLATTAWISLAAVIGLAVVGALYYALAAFFRRGLVAGLVYSFAIEGVCQFLPGSIQKLSLMHHVRSLVHRWSDEEVATLAWASQGLVVTAEERTKALFSPAAEEPWSSVQGALTVCGVVGFVALVLGAWAVSRKDFPLKD